VGQARQAAASLKPSTYAAAKWAAAQAKEAEAQGALGREDPFAAQQLYDEARRLYDETAREARLAAEAEARRKAEQAEATRLRQAAAAARAAAEEAGARQGAPGPFGDGEAAEQAGEGSFGRSVFVDAQSRFRAAEQAYQLAARQATEQQEVRAALADAQRLMGEGRADRALEALARVRALLPSHPELPRLESQAQRAMEARKTRERVRGLLENARKLTAHGELAKALQLAEEAVRLVPDDAAALRLRDDLRERIRQAGMPVPDTPSFEDLETAVKVGTTTRPGPVQRTATRPIPVPSDAEARPERRGGFGPSRIAIAAVVVLAVAGGAVYTMWPSPTPQPEKKADVPQPGPAPRSASGALPAHDPRGSARARQGRGAAKGDAGRA
jgi:hypothetical protein